MDRIENEVMYRLDEISYDIRGWSGILIVMRAELTTVAVRDSDRGDVAQCLP